MVESRLTTASTGDAACAGHQDRLGAQAMPHQADATPLNVRLPAGMRDQEIEVASRAVTTIDRERLPGHFLKRAPHDDIAVTGEKLTEDRILFKRTLSAGMVEHQWKPGIKGRSASPARRRRLPESLETRSLIVGQHGDGFPHDLLADDSAFKVDQLVGEPRQARVFGLNLEIVAMLHRGDVIGWLGRIPDVDQDRPGCLAGGIGGLVVEDGVVHPAVIELPERPESDCVRAGCELSPKRRRREGSSSRSDHDTSQHAHRERRPGQSHRRFLVPEVDPHTGNDQRARPDRGLVARISGATDGASSCGSCSKPAFTSRPLISRNVKVSPASVIASMFTAMIRGGLTGRA